MSKVTFNKPYNYQGKRIISTSRRRLNHNDSELLRAICDGAEEEQLLMIFGGDTSNFNHAYTRIKTRLKKLGFHIKCTTNYAIDGNTDQIKEIYGL